MNADDDARRELEHSHNAIQLVLEHSPTVFFLRDETDNQFTFVSDNVKMFGYKPKEFYSSTFSFDTIVHPLDRARVSRERQKYLDGKLKKYTMEYRIVSKSDEAHWVEEKGQIDRSPNGAALFTRGVLIDCTERKRAELILQGLVGELKSALQEVERHDRAKTDLIHVLAHDLKNPLSAVMLVVDLLLVKHAEMPAQAVDKRLSNVKTAILRMREIIDHVLAGNPTNSPTPSFDVEAVGLANCIESVVASSEPLASAKKIRLDVVADKRAPMAMCNRVAALHILENIVSNAIKFSPFNSSIHIRLSASKDFVRVSVSDQGPGFTDEDKKRLFQKFATLSAKPTGSESSTGLGLSIVKSYVDAMNGRVWCESEFGKGATFVVELPVADAPRAILNASGGVENAA